MQRDFEYLVVWDKPGTRSAPGRFYRSIEDEVGEKVEFIQRSVYGVKSLRGARKLAELAGDYGLKVEIFRIAEVLT